jgi:hypothetical protein
MAETVLQLDPRDNVLVALVPLAAGNESSISEAKCATAEIRAGWKIATQDARFISCK